MPTTGDRFGEPAVEVRVFPDTATGPAPGAVPGATPAPTPYRPSSGRKWWARPNLWFRLGRCLMVWPAGFAATVIATAFAAVVTLDLPLGGPLGWPLLFIMAGVAYSAAVGVPLFLLAGLRRWYLRLVPLAIIAAPLTWAFSEIGIWAAPGATVIAGSILFEAFAIRRDREAFARNRNR
jgi:hypothetical protein